MDDIDVIDSIEVAVGIDNSIFRVQQLCALGMFSAAAFAVDELARKVSEAERIFRSRPGDDG